MAELCGDFILNTDEVSRLRLCQSTYLVGNPANASDMVGELQHRKTLRSPDAPGWAAQPHRGIAWSIGRTFPEEVLSRALYATQFTRQIDRHGYVRFKHWRFFGENGLAGEDVSVWVYENTLKVEYQATALALYSLTFEQNTGRIAEVKNPRRVETHFRSPQLDLWQLSDTEWLLALRRPEPGMRKKRSKIIPFAQQLMLPDFDATG